MGIRSAIGQSKLLTFGLLVIGAWTVIQILAVLDTAESLFETGLPLVGAGTSVGSSGVAGIMGVLVLLGFLGLVVVMFGELGEADPTPETFPPEE